MFVRCFLLLQKNDSKPCGGGLGAAPPDWRQASSRRLPCRECEMLARQGRTCRELLTCALLAFADFMGVARLYIATGLLAAATPRKACYHTKEMRQSKRLTHFLFYVSGDGKNPPQNFVLFWVVWQWIKAALKSYQHGMTVYDFHTSTFYAVALKGYNVPCLIWLFSL